jgi:hypothetical protein
MRHVASLVVLSSLGGCSLIYNPSNIGTQQDGAPDAPFDAPIDSDPSMISVTGVRPLAITEGQGANGSRPAVIVIEGTNFVKANTTVTIAPSAPITKTPILTVDNTKIDVSADGFFITVPVSIPVDERAPAIGLEQDDSIALDITVMQDVPGGGTVMKTLPGVLKVVGLDELKTGGAIAGGAEHLYSFVQVTAPITAVAGSTMPIIIRSTSSLSVGAFNVSGTAMAGGPEGGTGGTSGSLVVAATPGTGPAGGQVSGGAGGFTTDVTVYSLGGIFRSSGGAGATAALGGGNGGGGGGTIMFVAGGDLTTGNGTSIGGAPTGSGGGGSGGVVVLRAGGNVTTGTMTLNGTGSGATLGAPGKLRYDAGGTATLMGSPTGFRGPQFVAPPLVVNVEAPMLQVVATPQAMIKYYITNAAGTMTSNAYSVTVPDSGPATVVNGTDVADRLSEGLNRICLVAGAGDLMSTTRNCIDIAYIGH